MNVYVKIEVLARELEGRLLLGLVAAERGHRVLLGDLRSLLSHRLWLPPGIYHDKGLRPTERRLALLSLMKARGFVITSQDEEHGLLQADYEAFARARYSDATLASADAVLAWGPHDGAHLRARYPSAAERIRVTGSPRTDTWRNELRSRHAGVNLPGIDPSRPYVLFASNSAALNRNPFWVLLRDMRPSYFARDSGGAFAETALYRELAFQMAYLPHVIDMLRALPEEIPGLQVIVRPHPTEEPGAWSDVLGDVEGLRVDSSGTLGAWLHGAAALVHNGSTSALEAAVGGTPLLSLQPVAKDERSFADRFGRTVRTTEELVAALQHVLAAGGAGAGGAEERALLAARLTALDGRLAADRIVDVWEELDPGGRLSRPFVPARALLAATTHRRIGALQARSRQLISGERPPQPMRLAEKFPPFAMGDVHRLVEGFRLTLGRFDTVEVRRVGRRMLELRSR